MKSYSHSLRLQARNSDPARALRRSSHGREIRRARIANLANLRATIAADIAPKRESLIAAQCILDGLAGRPSGIYGSAGSGLPVYSLGQYDPQSEPETLARENTPSWGGLSAPEPESVV